MVLAGAWSGRSRIQLSSSPSLRCFFFVLHTSRCRQSAERTTDFTKRTCTTWYLPPLRGRAGPRNAAPFPTTCRPQKEKIQKPMPLTRAARQPRPRAWSFTHSCNHLLRLSTPPPSWSPASPPHSVLSIRVAAEDSITWLPLDADEPSTSPCDGTACRSRPWCSACRRRGSRTDHHRGRCACTP